LPVILSPLLADEESQKTLTEKTSCRSERSEEPKKNEVVIRFFSHPAKGGVPSE